MLPNFTILGRGRAGRALAEALGGIVTLETREATPEGPVLLALPDSAIQMYSMRFPGRCAHLSGSLHLDGVPSLHPLTSFDGSGRDWDGVPLAVTGTPPKVILDAFISLGFVPFDLPANLKPLYHACAVLASGHAATLWVAADNILRSSGVTLPGRGLLGLAESALNNVKHKGPNGITGPFVRGDIETIQRDSQALPEEWRDLFIGLGRMTSGGNKRDNSPRSTLSESFATTSSNSSIMRE